MARPPKACKRADGGLIEAACGSRTPARADGGARRNPAQSAEEAGGASRRPTPRRRRRGNEPNVPTGRSSWGETQLRRDAPTAHLFAKASFCGEAKRDGQRGAGGTPRPMLFAKAGFCESPKTLGGQLDERKRERSRRRRSGPRSRKCLTVGRTYSNTKSTGSERR